jgi:hypothetical protein
MAQSPFMPGRIEAGNRILVNLDNKAFVVSIYGCMEHANISADAYQMQFRYPSCAQTQFKIGAAKSAIACFVHPIDGILVLLVNLA